MKKLLLILLLLLAFTFLPFTVFAGQVSLAWDAPTTYSDGSAIASGDLKNYRVRYGTQNGVYPNSVLVAATATTAVIPSLRPGTYYFVVTAIDQTDAESDYSNQVSKRIVVRAPFGGIR